MEHLRKNLWGAALSAKPDDITSGKGSTSSHMQQNIGRTNSTGSTDSRTALGEYKHANTARARDQQALDRESIANQDMIKRASKGTYGPTAIAYPEDNAYATTVAWVPSGEAPSAPIARVPSGEAPSAPIAWVPSGEAPSAPIAWVPSGEAPSAPIAYVGSADLPGGPHPVHEHDLKRHMPATTLAHDAIAQRINAIEQRIGWGRAGAAPGWGADYSLDYAEADHEGKNAGQQRKELPSGGANKRRTNKRNHKRCTNKRNQKRRTNKRRTNKRNQKRRKKMTF